MLRVPEPVPSPADVLPVCPSDLAAGAKRSWSSRPGLRPPRPAPLNPAHAAGHHVLTPRSPGAALPHARFGFRPCSPGPVPGVPLPSQSVCHAVGGEDFPALAAPRPAAPACPRLTPPCGCPLPEPTTRPASRLQRGFSPTSTPKLTSQTQSPPGGPASPAAGVEPALVPQLPPPAPRAAPAWKSRSGRRHTSVEEAGGRGGGRTPPWRASCSVSSGRAGPSGPRGSQDPFGSVDLSHVT